MEFSRTDMTNEVLEGLIKSGYVVKASQWNEAGTKLTVEVEKKGGK